MTLWSKITPWEEEQGETFGSWLQRIAQSTPGYKMQHRLEQQYPVLKEWSQPTQFGPLQVPKYTSALWGQILEQAPWFAMGTGLESPMGGMLGKLPAPKKLFSEIPESTITEMLSPKVAEQLAQKQLAQEGKIAPELVEKIAPKVTTALARTPEALLPIGETIKPSIPKPLAGAPKESLPVEIQTWLGNRTVDKGLADINGQISLLESKATPKSAKKLIKLYPIQNQLASAAEPKGVVLLEAPEALITQVQKEQIWNLARSKNLFRNNDVIPTAKRLAKIYTGKTSISQMTEGEADIYIKALESVVSRGKGLPPKIPVTTGIITEALADKIPLLKEIGVLERLRPSRQVFEKIGLRREIFEPAFEAEYKLNQELLTFRGELAGIEKMVAPEGRPKIFQALENPERVTQLNADEKVAYNWFKKYFDDWADKLKLPTEKRRQNYVTHIFEEAISQDLAAKHPIDPSIIRAMDFRSPTKVFNPYLQERLGMKTGLIEDPFAAVNAYEGRALRVFHYDPLIQRIRVLEQYLPPNSARYLRDYIARITNRPLPIDREINQTLKEFAGVIKKLPGGEELGAQMTRGNMGGLLAYRYTSWLYFLWLGFKPSAAIRNLGQQMLTFADVGGRHFANGYKLWATAEGKNALAESVVVQSRKLGFVPGMDTGFISRWTDAFREKALWMFQRGDKTNISQAFLAGYSEAKSLGLPREWCIRRGNEVAADTQFLYTKLGAASWSQSSIGRVLSPLTTWPANFLELMGRWFTGRPSQVYKEYIQLTGKEIPELTSWAMKRKSLIIFTTLVAGGYGIEKTTKFRASEYTGWTSLRYLADMLGGEFPGIDLPHGAAEISIGALTGDMRLLKTGWNRIRPDKVMGIVRQFENLEQGKTDWLSLFLYLNPEKEEQNKQYQPSGGYKPSGGYQHSGGYQPSGGYKP